MFQPMRLVSLLGLAMVLYSCNHSPVANNGEDSTAMKPAPVTFSDFITGLPLLTLPFTGEGLESIPGDKYPGIPHYTNIKAGRLQPVNGHTPVIFNGMMNEGHLVSYLIIYDNKGKESSRLQIEGAGYIDKQSIAYSEDMKGQDAYLWNYFGTDSLIELRCRYSFEEHGTTITDKTACYFYRITPAGHIEIVPRDTTSLTTFADSFPLKEAGFRLDSFKLNGLKPISKLTPYFNFGDVDVNIPVYAYGRMELVDKPLVLFYARDTVCYDEGGVAPEVDMITYDDKGRVAGKVMIKGGI